MKSSMQGLFLSLVFVFALLCLFAAGSAEAVSIGEPAAHQVFLFEHTNYGGANMSFEFDKDVPDLTKWRLSNSKKNWNDVISSLKVGKNTKILLYKHINYSVLLGTIQGDGTNVKAIPSLHSFGYGDQVSSFKVRMSDYAQ